MMEDFKISFEEKWRQLGSERIKRRGRNEYG